MSVWYSTGSIAVTNGSRNVVGTGTKFLANVLISYAIVIDGQIYAVEAVADDTHLTLSRNFTAATQSGVSYQCFPTQIKNNELLASVTELISSFGPLRGSVSDFDDLILQYADQVAQGASDAADSAAAANQSKIDAAGSASAAAGSATAANASKLAAIDAQDAAQDARDLAEDHKDAAEAAQSAAEGARDAAATSEANALESASDAADSASAAAGSASEASGYLSTVQDSADAAAASETAAAGSATAAAESASTTQGYLTTVQGIADDVQDDADQVAADRIAAAESAETAEEWYFAIQGDYADPIAEWHTEISGWRNEVETHYTDVIAKHEDMLEKHGEIDVWHTDVSDWHQETANNYTAVYNIQQDINDTAADVSADATAVAQLKLDVIADKEAVIEYVGYADAAKAGAEQARDLALEALDTFDDRYLGPKASDPVLDNDGDPLVGGALFFDTTLKEMRLYNGTEWVAAYVAGDGVLLRSGGTMTGQLTLSGAPMANLHAATKKYVDDAMATAGKVESVNGHQGVVTLTKSDVGLGNVDNTSDANKPVSTATQTALNLKANSADPTFTGTVNGITKGMVGLGNVDNTADADKPVSTAAQTALGGKLSLTGGTLTGSLIAPNLVSNSSLVARGTATEGGQLVLGYGGGVATAIVGETNSTWNIDVTSGNALRFFRKDVDGVSRTAFQIEETGDVGFQRPVTGITKAMVGLGNVDNTADADKTISTATQTALDGKAASSHTHEISDINGLQDALNTSGGIQQIETKTANYAFVLTDSGKIIQMNAASARSFTIPTNALVAFPIGSSIDLMRYGTGAVSIAASAGANLRASAGTSLRAQYSMATIIKIGTNEWVITGDTTP